MAHLSFTKYHGLGNDFILLDARSTAARITPAAARRLCSRNTGVGADGVLTLLPSRDPGSEARMDILNSDGSSAEMCGNGLRCVVHWLLRQAGKGHIRIETDVGIREGWLLPEGRVRVTLGVPRVIFDRVACDPFEVGLFGMGVSVGNPHLVLSPPRTSAEPLMARARALGPLLEGHPMFPARVNAGFLALRGDAEIDLVVFERGAGITKACGTGAVAAAFAARIWGLVRGSGSIRVWLPGGALDVDLADAQHEDPAAITGDANLVFRGTIALGPDEVEGSEEGK